MTWQITKTTLFPLNSDAILRRSAPEKDIEFVVEVKLYRWIWGLVRLICAMSQLLVYNGRLCESVTAGYLQ